VLLALAVISFILWIIIISVPWKPWTTQEHFDRCHYKSHTYLDDVTVLIPARNEAEQLKKTLPSILSQGEGIFVIVVDDCSDDDTQEVATHILKENGLVIRGKPLPEGWSGKLWALEQGLPYVKTNYILLLDADIILKEKVLSSALSDMRKKRIDFFSLMAYLQMTSLVERLFMPAFVYFFKLLYPFKLANRKGFFVAAAAGGFILTKTAVLKSVGAFSSIKGAIIDDCTLAKKVKQKNFSTFIGLTKCVKTIRKYETLGAIWRTVERTAYTQLKHNPFLLLLVTLLMVIAFLVPVAGLISGLITPSYLTLVISSLTLFIMFISYKPILRYYEQNSLTGLALPFVATFYLAMTWSSALKYYLGKGASWKGRHYN